LGVAAFSPHSSSKSNPGSPDALGRSGNGAELIQGCGSPLDRSDLNQIAPKIFRSSEPLE
jgi:hypothetical protein